MCGLEVKSKRLAVTKAGALANALRCYCVTAGNELQFSARRHLELDEVVEKLGSPRRIFKNPKLELVDGWKDVFNQKVCIVTDVILESGE